MRSPAVPVIRSSCTGRAPVHPAMAEEKYSPTTRPLAFWKTSANIRDNPVAIGVGVLAVFSQLNFVLLFVLLKLGLVTLPPLNAFTAITNAAMEERVQAGTLDKMVATGWANSFNFDLVKQFYASGAPDDFVLKYCMDKMEPEHFNWCLSAKEVVTGWEGGL